MEISSRMLLLSFISCLDCNETNVPDIENNMTKILQSVKKDLGFSNIVWGPVAHKKDEIFTDSLVFITQDNNSNNIQEYTIVIRGTNPFSISSWIFQDLNVSGLTPWSRQSTHTNAKNAFISKATDTSLALHCSLASNSKTIISWLTDLISNNPEKTFKINVTGHSLGGCMSATLALWLYDELNYRNMLKNTIIHIYAFAGPSAGNKDFSDYSDACFQQNLTRYTNVHDIAPYVWQENDMTNILPQIYSPDIQLKPFEQNMLNSLSMQVRSLNYTQPKNQKTIDSKVFDHFLFKDYLTQAAYQHVVPYLEYSFKEAPITLIKVVMDIIKSLIIKDNAVISDAQKLLSLAAPDKVPPADQKIALFNAINDKLMQSSISN